VSILNVGIDLAKNFFAANEMNAEGRPETTCCGSEASW
jgi:hypothetical protein